MTRLQFHTVLLLLLATLWLVVGAAAAAPADAPWCGMARVTGYVRGEFSPWTADGTSIWTTERIAAASWDVRMGSLAEVAGLGLYRVADRGALGRGDPMPWLDIAVWTPAEAFALTSVRHVCFRRPVA